MMAHNKQLRMYNLRKKKRSELLASVELDRQSE